MSIELLLYDALFSHYTSHYRQPDRQTTTTTDDGRNIVPVAQPLVRSANKLNKN